MTNHTFPVENEPDIYGQVHPIESTNLLKTKLHQFDKHVAANTNEVTEENECLIKALQQCPQLLTKSFKLKFLRCQIFNIDNAFRVFQRYWKKRVKVFGPDRAFAPMTLESFTDSEIAALESGYVTLLPDAFDPKGRSIVYVDPSKFDESKFSREDLCRAVWYVIHAGLERDSCQRHGQLMMIDLARMKMSHFDQKLCKMVLGSLGGSIPARSAGMHICKTPSFFSMVFPAVKAFFPEHLKSRLVVHSNGQKSFMKGMMKYGLEEDVLPMSLGGEVAIDQSSWIQQRQTQGQ